MAYTPSRRRMAQSTLRCICAAALAACGLVPLRAHAQAAAWPVKPVRLVVPVSPGGTTDMLARMVGEVLQRNLGQAFVVDGKPGAAGAIGALEVARAPADGYTLLVGTSSTHSVAPAVSTHMRYNPVDDFTPIALLAEASNVLLVSPTLGVKNVKELVALAKQKPASLNYSSSGIGSFGNLTMEFFANQAGVKLTHIPYKGTSSSITDLVGGSVHLAADAIPSAMPHVKEGRLLGLAVTGPRRSSLAPEIPTVAEAGVPGFSVLSWFGLFAPRGLPPELARRINDEVNKVLASPEMAARFATLGIEPAHGSPADFTAMIAADTVRWTRVARDVKIKLD